MLQVELALGWRLGRRAPAPVDPTLFALLEGIADRGSLQAAARQTGVSYRHAWGLLNGWRESLGQPLATLERGRGTRLTAFGAGLLSVKRAVEARLGAELSRAAADVAASLALPCALVARTLRVHASHDLALLRARERLAAAHGLELDLEVHGSHDCLEALVRRRCDVAGFHTSPDAPLEAMLGELFPRGLPEPIIAYPLFGREQGLIIRAGLQPPVRTLAELAAGGARFINRQRGSGTRILFDRLLRQAGMRATDIRGYRDEELTHLAVAATVAGGGADAGFGIRAAAAQFGLAFVPLAVETYAVACREARASDDAIGRFVGFLRGAELRSICAALPGYDASRAGAPLRIGPPRRRRGRAPGT